MNPSGGDWKEMFQAAATGDVELVRYYLKQGIDPNYQHPEFLTNPLIESAQEGQLAVVELLLASGADPFQKSEMDGWTALEVAKIKQHKEVVRLLEKHMGIPPKISFLDKIKRGLGG
ncbi:MAG: ankyrin repeat domain-containing protein [Bacteroidota bacterium]